MLAGCRVDRAFYFARGVGRIARELDQDGFRAQGRGCTHNKRGPDLVRILSVISSRLLAAVQISG